MIAVFFAIGERYNSLIVYRDALFGGGHTPYRINMVADESNYQTFCNGEITVKDVEFKKVYSKKYKEHIWRYKMTLDAECKREFHARMMLLDEYKSEIKTLEDIGGRVEEGTNIIKGTVNDYTVSWYDDIEYVGLFESIFYDERYFHRVIKE